MATATVISGHPCRNHRRRDPQPRQAAISDWLLQRRKLTERALSQRGDLPPLGVSTAGWSAWSKHLVTKLRSQVSIMASLTKP